MKRMMMTAVAVLMLAAPARAEVPAPECVGAVVQSGLAEPEDFEPITLDDGRPAVRVFEPESGKMFSCIGGGDHEEAYIMIRPTQETKRASLLLLFDVADRVAAWPEAPDWIVGTLKTMDEAGGKSAIVQNNHRVTLTGFRTGVFILEVQPEN